MQQFLYEFINMNSDNDFNYILDGDGSWIHV